MTEMTDLSVATPDRPDPKDTRINLVGLSREELEAVMGDLGHPKFRARQIWHWMYHRGAKSFDEMTTLAKAMRPELAKSCVITRPTIVSEQLSEDRTRKWLMNVPGGGAVETVFIPEEDRGALCLSSQVGCALTCKFCHTGTQNLVRNLDAADIVGQMLIARDTYGEWPSPSGNRMLSNIVMMGMGEPLLNFDNVAKALRIIMDNEGISISKRRITLSTAGYVPNMSRCGEELGVNLAVSLHAPETELRGSLIPLEKRHPLPELLEALRKFDDSGGRRITFEYTMIRGVNDDMALAPELAQIASQVRAFVNLIPFNPIPYQDWRPSPPERIREFAAVLEAAGVSVAVRETRGRDIDAACGQLRAHTLVQLEKGRR